MVWGATAGHPRNAAQDLQTSDDAPRPQTAYKKPNYSPTYRPQLPAHRPCRYHLKLTCRSMRQRMHVKLRTWLKNKPPDHLILFLIYNHIPTPCLLPPGYRYLPTCRPNRPSILATTFWIWPRVAGVCARMAMVSSLPLRLSPIQCLGNCGSQTSMAKCTWQTTSLLE